MIEKKVDRSEWNALVRTLNERYAGTDVSVTIMDPEMGEHYQMEPEPLLEIATGSDPGTGRFDLTIGTSEAPMSHAVPWARDVWLESNDAGTEEIVAIVGENGIMTVLRCRGCED